MLWKAGKRPRPTVISHVLALAKTDGGVGIGEVAPPTPTPDEVVVKVMCAGLCRTDLYLAEGRLPASTPLTLGHECSGVVCRLGASANPSLLGQRVAVFPWIGCGSCRYCVSDEEKLGHLCPERRFVGWHRNGCFAEFMAVPANRCFPLDEEVSFQAGAYLEPLTAALGVLRTPVREAARAGVMGENRIARLTRMVLTEFAGTDLHEVEGANSLDLVVETEATRESVTRAFHCLRPDGVLVLKSRPAEDVLWPTRLQVEKEITTIAVGYGSLRMAMMLLKSKCDLFLPFWAEPRPLGQWEKAFREEREGRDSLKTFFLPQER